jgi:hypothetical protein
MEFTEACRKALCSFPVSASICSVFLVSCRLLSCALFFLAFQEFPTRPSPFIASGSPFFLRLRE